MEKTYYIEARDTLDELPLFVSVHAQKGMGKGVMAQAHIHDYIEIIYALSGEYVIALNNTEHHFATGDLVLINSNEVHNIESLTQGCNQYIVIKFVPEILYTNSQSLFEMKYAMPFILNESTHQKVFQKKEIEHSVVPGIITLIYEEFTLKKYGYELAVRANIINLFLFILRSWHDRNMDLNLEFSINKEMLNRLDNVFEYIEQNYQQDITSLEMAKISNLSYSYFSRTFKKIMKKSFKEYFIYFRITKAEKLLLTSRYNITEIAQAVGFSTSSYFIQQFKKYKGISPKQFQKKYRVDLTKSTPDVTPN